MSDIQTLARNARLAAQKLAAVPIEKKNLALDYLREELEARKDEIIEANKKDKEAAETAVKEGAISASLFKRLDIEGPGGSKFKALLEGVGDVKKLDDPCGKVTLATHLDEGLDLYRVTCPVGVICIIFEARPEVNIQISSLTMKSGNAVILKGGKEAAHSNAVLVDIVQSAFSKVPEIPKECVQLVTTRDEIGALLEMDEYIDLVIPRGGKSLIKHVQSKARMPVLGHADGICGAYIDESAVSETAAKVLVDSKTQYCAACNALERVLVHRSKLNDVWPVVAEALIKAGVEIRADKDTKEAIMSIEGAAEKVKDATEEDFMTEFLEFTLGAKVVDDLDEAIDYINATGSHHTDLIVTENKANAEKFMHAVDSAGVYHNASTRFADGFRYGFGAEIGVGTNKTHARGPVGLEGLIIYKYKLYGHGQTAGEYSGADATKKFLHTPIQMNGKN
eukprot:Clim_evm30s148 gene=Clim_evmTU30s148